MNGAKNAHFRPHGMPFLRPAAGVLALAGLLAACGPDAGAQVKSASESAARLQNGVVEFATEQRRWPTNIDELKVAGDALPGVRYGVSEGGMISIWFGEGSGLPGAALRYTPTQDATGAVTWVCVAEKMDAALKPADCR